MFNHLKLLSFTSITMVLVAFVYIQILQPSYVRAQSSVELDVEIQKNVAGQLPPGYEETQFAFVVSGPGFTQDVYVTPDGPKFTATLPLSDGTYTITEIGPAGFNPDDWEVQWSGACKQSDSNQFEATFVVAPNHNNELGDQPCRAKNKWRPEKEDNGGGGTSTATLNVTKVIVGTTTVPANAFSFSYSGTDSGTHTFEADGTNILTLNKGTYSVTENPAQGYVTTYNNCSNINLTSGATSTCVITNTATSTGSGGGGGTATGTLLVTKEIVGTTTVPVTNFAFTYTGAPGNINFESDGTNTLKLPAGTYSVTESPLRPGYTVSYNNCSSITILAGATTTCVITNTATTSTGGGGNGTATGTLHVTKVIVGTTTVPTTAFSFSYSGTSTGAHAFEADGTNTLALPVGTYSITENAAPGYLTTYQNCSNISLTSGATTTCTITNTATLAGGGGAATGTLRVSKVIMGTTTVSTTNFSFTYTGGGNISFEADGTNVLQLPVGIYSVSESSIPAGYLALYNNCSNLVIAANATTTCIITNTATTSGGSSTTGTIVGNVDGSSTSTAGTISGEVTDDDENDTGGGGGGGGRRSSGGGGGDDDDDDDDSSGGGGGGATPEVLGESTSVTPLGAPNTGGGGTSPQQLPQIQTLFAILSGNRIHIRK